MSMLPPSRTRRWVCRCEAGRLRHVVEGGDVVGDLVVVVPVFVLGPGVEVPVGDGEFAFGVGCTFGEFFYEDGA